MILDLNKKYSAKELNNIFKECPIHNLKYRKIIDGFQYTLNCDKCNDFKNTFVVTRIRFFNNSFVPWSSIINKLLYCIFKPTYTFDGIIINFIAIEKYSLSYQISISDKIPSRKKLYINNNFMNDNLLDLTKFINFVINKNKYIVLL